MKKKFFPYLIFGIATGIIAWACQEFLFILIKDGVIPSFLQSVLSGTLLGAIIGAIIGRLEGFIVYNKPQAFKGTVIGVFFGGISGLFSFYLVDYIQQYLPSIVAGNTYYLDFLLASRWTIISVFIGIAIGIRDQKNLKFARGVFSGIISGIIGSGLSIPIFSEIHDPFWARGVHIVSFVAIIGVVLVFTSTFGRKEWIKALNGKYEGIDFELTQDIHLLGSQVDDDINLSSYQNVNRTHAKLLKYYTGYSLVDNDPFGQTFVNFRSIKEQPLKNGDILKIGNAIFQYCKKAS